MNFLHFIFMHPSIYIDLTLKVYLKDFYIMLIYITMNRNLIKDVSLNLTTTIEPYCVRHIMKIRKLLLQI